MVLKHGRPFESLTTAPTTREEKTHARSHWHSGGADGSASGRCRIARLFCQSTRRPSGSGTQQTETPRGCRKEGDGYPRGDHRGRGEIASLASARRESGGTSTNTRSIAYRAGPACKAHGFSDCRKSGGPSNNSDSMDSEEGRRDFREICDGPPVKGARQVHRHGGQGNHTKRHEVTISQLRDLFTCFMTLSCVTDANPREVDS